MAGWYVRRGEKVVGPVELGRLKELVAAGKLLPTDLLAKDVTGPWKQAGRTTLYATEPATPPTPSKADAEPASAALVPKTEQLPAVAEPRERSRTITQVTGAVFLGIGRGVVATWSALSRSLTTRAQRRHELKLAKIHAKAIAESRRPPASKASATPQTTGPPPQVVQSTVVKIVNRHQGGCSGCGLILLLILLGVLAPVIFGSIAPTS